MILQFAINQQGFAFIAGFTATNKIYGVLESSAISIGHAISTYSAQNYGAGLYSRIRKGLKSALTIGLSISTAISVVMILFGKHVVSLFIDKANESSGEVLDVAYNYLFVMCLALFILYLLHIFRCTLMGLGNASAPFWSGVMEFFARVSIAIFFTKWFGTGALYFAEPGAWLASILVLIPVCLKIIRKLPLEKGTK
jgi:Na+-driven multidrug efflux pump